MVIISDDTIDNLKRVAERSHVTHKHAAGILIGKNVVNIYCNNFSKKLSMSRSNEKSAHAETKAIYSYLASISQKNRAFASHRIPINIIVIRVKNNTLRNSRPCKVCIPKLAKIGINKVYYSDNNGDIVSEYISDMLVF